MNIRENINNLRKEVVGFLPPIEGTSTERLSEIFLTYDSFIRPNFIMWLMLNKPTLKSEVAIKACEDNLECEINDNHPQLLLNFIEPIIRANIMNEVVIKNVENKIIENFGLINKITQFSSMPLTGLYVMAILENTSIEFVVWMKKASEKLGLKNKKYLDVHGEADILHANEFLNALESEIDLQDKKPSDEYLDETKEVTLKLLKVIFT